MIKVPTITQLKQLISHIQGIVFPDYYPAVEAPHSLNLPDEFWSQIPEITRLLQTMLCCITTLPLVIAGK